MNKKSRPIIILVSAFIMLFFALCTTNTYAKTKVPKLSTKKVSIYAGENKSIKLNNVHKKSKVES